MIEETVAMKINEMKENSPEENLEWKDFDDGTPPKNISKREVFHLKKKSDMYLTNEVDESTMLYFEPFPDPNIIFNSYEDAENYAIAQWIKIDQISEPWKMDRQYAIFTKSLYIAE